MNVHTVLKTCLGNPTFLYLTKDELDHLSMLWMHFENYNTLRMKCAGGISETASTIWVFWKYIMLIGWTCYQGQWKPFGLLAVVPWAPDSLNVKVMHFFLCQISRSMYLLLFLSSQILCTIHPCLQPVWCSRKSIRLKSGKPRFESPLHHGEIAGSPWATHSLSLTYLTGLFLLFWRYNREGENNVASLFWVLSGEKSRA